MPTKVMFHQLQSEIDYHSSSFQRYVCDFVTSLYEQRQLLTVLCLNNDVAEQLDELLWQQPSDKFVPHNLADEGDGKPSPVVLISVDKIGINSISKNTACLINLSAQLPIELQRYGTIHEFVPIDEAGKVSARERFKAYKQQGCELSFVN